MSALEVAAGHPPADGVFSVWCGPLDGPAYFTRDDAVPHYAASTMKLPLLIAAHRLADRGVLALDEAVPVHDEFRSAHDGSTFRMSREYDDDPSPWARLGERVPLQWLAERSIVRSSNLGANLLLEAVGLAEVAATLADLGARDTTITRGIEDVVAREAGMSNLVSARDLAALLQALGTGRAASPDACREMLDVLAAVETGEGIAGGLPPGTRTSRKSGWVDGVRHDAGLVTPPSRLPFVLVVLASAPVEDAVLVDWIAQVAAAAWTDLGRES